MKRTPGKTFEERQKYWTKIIEEARKFPSGVNAYCTENGISTNNYYSWFKKLRVSHPEWMDLANRPAEPRKQTRKGRNEKGEKPSTEIAQRPRRRKFNAKEKARILKEVESSSKGQIAGILRREGVYASQLQKWCTERDLAALEPKKRGPKGNPLTVEVRSLKAKLARAEKQLKQANAIIDIQKKISDLLGITTEDSAEETQ
jgi:transposase-like protein